MPMSIPLSMSSSVSSWDNTGQYSSVAEPKFAEMNTVNAQVYGDILLQAAQNSYIFPENAQAYNDILLQAAQNSYIFPDYSHQPTMVNVHEMKLKKDLDDSKEHVNHLDKTIKTLRHEVRRQSRQILSYKQLFKSIATKRQLFRACQSRSVVHLNTRFMGRTLALIPNQPPLKSGTNSGNKLTTNRRNTQKNFLSILNSTNNMNETILTEPDSMTVKGKSPFTCFDCDKTFSRKGHLKRHILKIHDNKNRTAGTSFSYSKVGVNSNVVRSHTDRQPIVKNEADAKGYQCWNSFSQPVELTHDLSYMSHSTDVLNDSKSRDKPHKCKYCHETFTYISQRDIHQKSEHTGEDPLKCSYCTKSFSIHCNLRAHERVHTGEKPFQCRYCPKAFVQVSHRNCHERTHTGERPYQCALCSRAFAVLGNLKSHQLTHNDQRPRPHNCNFCSKSFYTPRSLKTHVKTHQLY